MSNMLDKNGNPLRGSARWLRQISEDGGMEKHDKTVAMKVFEAFLDTIPSVAELISEHQSEERRRKFKIVK